MIIIFYIFAVLLIYLSYRSFRSGFDYLNYFRRELAKPRSEYLPFVTIIAPCKGLDPGLTENFTGLMHQDHGEYEVLFVVDDASDPAASVIEDVWQQSNKHVKLIVAAKAVDSGQKVENLREGVIHADERSEVFVFVDSDARPAATWLRDLIAPLADGRVGAATGYRWFVSERASFASEMRSAWNASIASALGPDSTSNFCWGGSTAIRRETFERLNIRERWAGTLSDDFTLTRAIREAELPIVFVPQALTHVALVNSARNLASGGGPSEHRIQGMAAHPPGTTRSNSRQAMTHVASVPAVPVQPAHLDTVAPSPRATASRKRG